MQRKQETNNKQLEPAATDKRHKIMKTSTSIIKTNGRIEYYQRQTKSTAATMARCIGDKKWHQVSCQEFLTDFDQITDRLNEIGELNF